MNPATRTERDRCVALLRQLARDETGDVAARRTLERAAKQVAKCPDCGDLGVVGSYDAPCTSCDEGSVTS